MNFDNISETDVAILPRSGSLLYTSEDPREITKERNQISNFYAESYYSNNYLNIGEYKIEPNGIDNNFPANYKALLDSVYLAHGVKRTLINLLLSGGIGIYSEIKEEKKIIRDWQLDSEITDWLESFNFTTEYIAELATDMIYIENCYTLFQRNKGAKFGGTPKFAALKYLPVERMRLEYPNETGKRNNVFYSDWLYNSLNPAEIQPFPIFDNQNPFKNPNSVMFIKMPTFGSTSYGRPADIGAAQLLKVLSLLPNFHKANLTEKGFKWIVAVSTDYYQSIRDKYAWDENSKEWKDWKKKFQQSIDEFLAAPEGDKVQTRFMTEFIIDPHTLKPIQSIQITKLEDDTKELSTVGMDLHDTYTIGYVSANSVHPQLANVSLKNHALSGSELREAYEMHIKTSTPTMRTLLLHPVNTALKLNYPAKNLKIGFMDIAFDDYNPVKSNKPVNAKSNE